MRGRKAMASGCGTHFLNSNMCMQYKVELYEPQPLPNKVDGLEQSPGIISDIGSGARRCKGGPSCLSVCW